MDRCILLAGSQGPERTPARPHPDDADWYLPLHLRDAQAARARLASQVTLGVDAIVAPTWLTHRRALLPLGETRRAGAWTAAAVQLAREAMELGVERRQELADAGAAEGEVAPPERPAPVVAAVLPSLEEEALVASGRLLPRESATARDYRDQAGLLADAEPDLILVEAPATEADARTAVEAAAGTGLPVWAAFGRALLATAELGHWLDLTGALGVARLLLPPPFVERVAAAEGTVPWGGMGVDAPEIGTWLEAGAGAMALLDGATPVALEPVRSAIDAYERTRLEAEEGQARRWLEHVRQAAAMAPGGGAVWVGPAPGARLPEGFDWIVVSADEVANLPEDRYGLAVAVSTPEPELTRSLRDGGILSGPLPHPTGVHLLLVDDAGDGEPLAISRREDGR